MDKIVCGAAVGAAGAAVQGVRALMLFGLEIRVGLGIGK